MLGQRVVVRYLLEGQRGPSGGPAVTDVLGECLAWGEGQLIVRRADQTTVQIPLSLVVSGKPVPPRPSVRLRVSPVQAHERASHLWPDLEVAQLGGWLLRSSATAEARRANSALAMRPSLAPDPVAAVIDHYERLALRPVVCVLPDTAEEELFRRSGWVPDRRRDAGPEADTLFQLAGVAGVRRQLGDRPAFGVRLTEQEDRVEASIGDQATGRASYGEDWVGLHGLEVRPERRRRGLGLALVAALLDWAAERGATTAYLQVHADNEPARALYEGLGFTTHHAYRYLVPGADSGAAAGPPDNPVAGAANPP